MNDFILIAQASSNEIWLALALFVMIAFNIIWEVIKPKLIDDKTAKKVAEINGDIEEIAKKIDQLYRWHDDHDPISGTMRWKMSPTLLEMIKEELTIIREMSKQNAVMSQHIQSLGDNIQTLTQAINRFSDRSDRRRQSNED